MITMKLITSLNIVLVYIMHRDYAEGCINNICLI